MAQLNIAQCNSLVKCNEGFFDLVVFDTYNDSVVTHDEPPFVPIDVFHPPLFITFPHYTFLMNLLSLYT